MEARKSFKRGLQWKWRRLNYFLSVVLFFTIFLVESKSFVWLVSNGEAFHHRNLTFYIIIVATEYVEFFEENTKKISNEFNKNSVFKERMKNAEQKGKRIHYYYSN